MSTRKLLSNTALYGFGDVIVLAVGGFLLLPLYTRALTQAEFGVYTIVKTNTEILVYLLQFGLISAIGRLYFEYKRKNEHYQYLSSVFLLFLILALLFCIIIYIFGEGLWNAVSPNVPAFPFLWFSLVIALFSFAGSFASIWLRVEEKAKLFVIVQIASALVLLVLVIFNLVIAPQGLIGLLYALAMSAICAAAVLPFLFWKRLTFRIERKHVSATLRYGLPIFFGYVAYFITNKISLIILQRNASLEQVAIFGIAQQLGMVVMVASGAFAKSLQPVIFAAEIIDFDGVIDKLGKLYLLIMFCIVSLLILFASEIFQMVAPANYSDGFYVFIAMIATGFIIATNFIFSSTLLYFKMSTTSVLVTIFGGFLSLIVSLILVPKFNMFGAVASIFIAYIGVVLANAFLTRKLLPRSNCMFGAMLFLAILPVVIFSVWLRDLNVNSLVSIIAKLACLVTITCFTYFIYSRIGEIFRKVEN